MLVDRSALGDARATLPHDCDSVAVGSHCNTKSLTFMLFAFTKQLVSKYIQQDWSLYVAEQLKELKGVVSKAGCWDNRILPTTHLSPSLQPIMLCLAGRTAACRV